MRSIVQRLLVMVYHFLCNTVYFIIAQAYGYLGKKKKPQSQHVSFSIFSPFSWSFWALLIKITFVSGHILSQNVKFVVKSLIISACTKTWNNKTKRPKRNDRCDWNKTTTTIETSGCWKVADFTSDILSHLRILHIKAVTRNLIFFSSTQAAETIIWHL